MPAATLLALYHRNPATLQMVRRTRKSIGHGLSLDSLVDIVSNNVGILIILAAFMALLAFINPSRLDESVPELSSQPTKRLLVPWSHPTNKNTIFFSLRGNRVQFIDLRRFYLALAARQPNADEAPVVVRQSKLEVRFYPVTNQVYCMEMLPGTGAGETWYEAQQPRAEWQEVLRRYPAEQYTYFFWVAGDSFELFRDIRATLWEADYEVGWKPALRDAPLELCNGFEGSTAFQPQ